MPRIGLISDTHSLLRPEAVAILRGSDHIIHAGDIGDMEVLTALRRIAPTTAVRGNNDRGNWASAIAETEVVEVGGVLIFVIHDIRDLGIDPKTAGMHIVVSGHSHKPLIKERNDVWFVNPGSAGARRFTLPISVAEIKVTGKTIKPRIIELAVEDK